MNLLLLCVFLLAPTLIRGQAGENCLPTLSQTVQQTTTNGSSTFYHVVLNITNTGFNKQFEESTTYSTANLPLNIAILNIGYEEHITIVSTFGLALYDGNPSTYSLLLNGADIAYDSSFLGAGYVSLDAIPSVQLDVWGCDYSSLASTTSGTCSTSVTISPVSSWDDQTNHYQQFGFNVENVGSQQATSATVQINLSNGNIVQWWNMSPLDGTGPDSQWELTLFGLQAGSTFTGNGFIWSISLAEFALQGESTPYGADNISTTCSSS